LDRFRTEGKNKEILKECGNVVPIDDAERSTSRGKSDNKYNHPTTNITIRSECWVLNTIHKSKIEAAEMRMLRLIIGVTLGDRVRSEAIREELEVLPIM